MDVKIFQDQDQEGVAIASPKPCSMWNLGQLDRIYNPDYYPQGTRCILVPWVTLIYPQLSSRVIHKRTGIICFSIQIYVSHEEFLKKKHWKCSVQEENISKMSRDLSFSHSNTFD